MLLSQVIVRINYLRTSKWWAFKLHRRLITVGRLESILELLILRLELRILRCHLLAQLILFIRIWNRLSAIIDVYVMLVVDVSMRALKLNWLLICFGSALVISQTRIDLSLVQDTFRGNSGLILWALCVALIAVDKVIWIVVLVIIIVLGLLQLIVLRTVIWLLVVWLVTVVILLTGVELPVLACNIVHVE